MSGSGESVGGEETRGSGGDEPFDPQGLVWVRVSPRLATLRRMTSLLALVVILVLLFALPVLFRADDSDTGDSGLRGVFGSWTPVVFGTAVVLILATVWEMWVIGRQVAAYQYAEREDDLLVRHGVMWRTIVVVPYGRMQYVDVTAGPIERSFGLATVRLHTASAATDATVPGLLPEDAARLRDRLSERGQSRLAGL